jgi:hypothetical protein
MGPDSFLEKLSSIVHLSEKQRAQISEAYFESLVTLRVESHCAHEIKRKEGKKACGRELVDGKCPIHKLNVYAPVVVEKKMCVFPGAKACSRRATDGSMFCAFHKDKTPEDKKTLCCKFVFQAGAHKGETCGVKFCDYSKYQAPGQLPELKRPDDYDQMTKSQQLEWEENTSELVRDFFAEMHTSPQQYLGQYMNQYCPTHYLDVISKEIKKESANVKYNSKEKTFTEKKQKEKKPNQKKPVILDDDSEDDGDSKEEIYPKLNFRFPDNWSAPCYIGVKVDGQGGYCRPTWRDEKTGQKFRSPFLVEASKVQADLLEILGYTLIDERNQLVSSEIIRQYHPMMDEFIELMKKHDRAAKVYITEHIKDKM